MITCYDGANRVSQVGCVSCGSPALTAYASRFAYAAHGAPTQYAMGNNIWHEPSYNSRLQMSGFVDLVNNSYTNELLGVGLNWNQSNNATRNNGNLWSATYNNGIPGYTSFLTFTDTFGYDGVNRLTIATDQVTANGVTSNGWSRSFAYDAFGNMTPSGNPNPPTESFNTNNQITGLSYDQAGNQLSVNGNTLAYDFENHVVSETDGVTQAVESYVYDGDGRRVMKSGPSGTSVFVYDAMGQLAGEYGSVASMPPCLTCYLTPDHLGTPRLITDQSGNVVARHDYLPFGEEVAANTFGRNSQLGAGNDSVWQKFTAKERDSESGLDYFGARYYESNMGRFQSPDPLLCSARLSNPQTWNRYAYTLNNPLRLVDPTGLYDWDSSAGGDMSDYDLNAIAGDRHNKRHKWAKNALAFRNDFRNALDAVNEAAGSSQLSDDEQAAAQAGVDAYGTEGDGNGVNVGIESGYGGSTVLNDDDTFSVKFGSGILNNANFLAVTVDHEGVHVAQGNAWLDGGESSVADINHYMRETAAWTVGSNLARALGMKSLAPHGGGPEFQVWNKGWKAADFETMRSKGLAKIMNYMSKTPTDTDTYSSEHHHKD